MSKACSISLNGVGLLGTSSSDKYRGGNTDAIRLTWTANSLDMTGLGGLSLSGGNNFGTCHDENIMAMVSKLSSLSINFDLRA